MKRSKQILIFVFLFLAFAFAGATIYTLSNFTFLDGNPLAQVIFHIMVPAEGTGSNFIKGIAIQCVIIPLLASFFITFVLSHKTTYFEFSVLDKYKFRPFLFIKRFSVLISAILLIISFSICANKMMLKNYIVSISSSTSLYEDEYIDPRNVDFIFPEEKRNLIYIFLESVEISDYSFEEGGAFPDNYIPELYQLAEENITFNNNKGYHVMTSAGWTVASMVAQTCGVNLHIPIDGNSYISETSFLKGAYSIGEILEKEGYTNELLIGSDAMFGGRKDYFAQHGNYLIHDYNWAVEEGLVDYYVWWGYEDHKLFEIARDELTKLSENEEPFNFTMLTVDTHHVGGYFCEYCENQYDENYANVYACQSRQVYEFVEWIKQQDFYENTTIILVGDHCSMDTGWANLMPKDYNRMAYYTIINPAEGCTPTENREFYTADFYPTTVAALGIKWDGDRLALGTNLFSDRETLIEQYGLDEINMLTGRHSYYYDNHILYGQ